MIHQLREPVSVQTQGIFFAEVRNKRQALLGNNGGHRRDDAVIMARIDRLLETKPLPEGSRMRLYFVHLACCESIEALRFAENLVERCEGEARELALLAELELRMRIYEDLTEQPQALLASGLGGEGELIRLNGIAMQRNFEPWQDYQRELLHQELTQLCEEQGGYIEEELWGQEYYGFRLMLPYYMDIAEMIEQYLNTCNEYGQFLHPDCHVTNMILLKHEHIQEVVLMRKRQRLGLDIGVDIDAMLNKILGNPQDADDADASIQGNQDNID